MRSDIDPQLLWKRHSDKKIIQIYGSAGSGKSTIAMHFANFILSGSEGRIFWIDTERKASQKRLQQILGENTKSLFISQPKSYQEQQKLIKAITSIDLPTSALVVDTISRHFRSIHSHDKWIDYSENLQEFYEYHLLPLLSFQKRNKCYLILLHQITYVSDEGDKPFLYKIFQDINSNWIYLGQ